MVDGDIFVTSLEPSKSGGVYKTMDGKVLST